MTAPRTPARFAERVLRDVVIFPCTSRGWIGRLLPAPQTDARRRGWGFKRDERNREDIAMSKTPIVYLELPSKDVAVDKQFYGSLFGWSFMNYGPEYASFSDSGLAGGLNGSTEDRTKAPLAVLDTDDLEAMAVDVVAAGGTITMPIFSFPGGRRFHFTDPSGNELAVMQKA